jgi:hypothetical protein
MSRMDISFQSSWSCGGCGISGEALVNSVDGAEFDFKDSPLFTEQVEHLLPFPRKGLQDLLDIRIVACRRIFAIFLDRFRLTMLRNRQCVAQPLA